jgi:hypothetical protein
MVTSGIDYNSHYELADKELDIAKDLAAAL